MTDAARQVTAGSDDLGLGRGRGVHLGLEGVREMGAGLLDRHDRPVEPALRDVAHDDDEAARVGRELRSGGLLGRDRQVAEMGRDVFEVTFPPTESSASYSPDRALS